MKRAKDYLTQEQCNVRLNGLTYNRGDSCVGRDLDKILDKFQESLEGLRADFEYRNTLGYDDPDAIELTVTGLIGWSASRVYLLLPSGFGDEYITSIPRNPQDTGVNVTGETP